VDVDAYLYLFPLVDKQWLNEIEYPTLPPDYFRLYHKGLGRAVVHGDAVVVDLGEIYTPDMVAEIADHLLYVEGVRWALAMATYHDHLHLSLRGRDRRTNAGRLVREIFEPRGGSAGGHGSMAGARMALPRGARLRAKVKRELLARFLEEFGVKGVAGIPLLQLGLDRA
jgi:nanoRNase/pAp phosphatase (c-di-AMP/oligoRNAs hydrolase)